MTSLDGVSAQALSKQSAHGRGPSAYLFELLGVGIGYFVLAKIGLALALVNSSTSAIWPATGFALASGLLWGYRVGPAVFVAAFAANVTNGVSIYAATAIAVGNMLEALIAAWLINLWSDGRQTFATPMGVAKFALICVPSTIISATVGIAGLILTGHHEPIVFPMTWMTWWLGDLAGALVVAPFVVLWAASELYSLQRIQSWEAGAVVAVTVAVGVIAFSPLIEHPGYRDPLGFLVLAPLLWAALLRDQRETATAAIVLACFAVWGTLAGSGPFMRNNLNESFLLLVMFFISISVPSLALGAGILVRRRSEETLRRAQDELETRAVQLKDIAERLRESNVQLEERVEQRTHNLNEALQFQTATANFFKAISPSMFDLKIVLDQLVESSAQLCAADRAILWRRDGETYRIVAEFGQLPESLERLVEPSTRAGQDTVVARTLAERRVIHILDARSDPDLRQRFERSGTRTIVGVPLMQGNIPIGVLIMLRQTVRPFTEREIELAATFADKAVIAIERMRLIEELQANSHELKEANCARSRFIAAASHDLRQPLHALGLFVDRLQGRVKAAERRQIVEQIDASVATLNELFNDLLDMSKFDAGVMAPNISEFPVAQLLERTESMFSATARKKGLSLRIVRNSSWVRSDFILLERILLNLVSNAVSYTPRGKVVVGCRLRGRQLRMDVCDSGPGIPEDEHINIFREFYQLGGPQRERQGGMGLGLAIVNRLCVLLKHEINFASSLGKGSRFSVLVPSVAAQALNPEPKAPAQTTLDSIGGKLVVVIDDDPLVLDSTGGLLRSWNCHVLTVDSARAALVGLAECNQPPDLIISDYQLSDGQTGIQAIEELRKSLKLPIPAFLISGDTAPERMREVLNSGYHLLHKPVRPRALRAMLSKFLKTHDLVEVPH